MYSVASRSSSNPCINHPTMSVSIVEFEEFTQFDANKIKNHL